MRVWDQKSGGDHAEKEKVDGMTPQRRERRHGGQLRKLHDFFFGAGYGGAAPDASVGG